MPKLKAIAIVSAFVMFELEVKHNGGDAALAFVTSPVRMSN